MRLRHSYHEGVNSICAVVHSACFVLAAGSVCAASFPFGLADLATSAADWDHHRRLLRTPARSALFTGKVIGRPALNL